MCVCERERERERQTDEKWVSGWTEAPCALLLCIVARNGSCVLAHPGSHHIAAADVRVQRTRVSNPCEAKHVLSEHLCGCTLRWGTCDNPPTRPKTLSSYSCGGVRAFCSLDGILCTRLCECVHARVPACPPTLLMRFCQPRLRLLCSEADSLRVERAGFDVRDYDITDVQRRSGDPCSPTFSPFHIPVARYSKRKEGEIDRGGNATIQYLARKRQTFFLNTKCLAE